MITIPERIFDELKDYRNKVGELNRGSIDAHRFKPYRVSMGIYEQRERDTYMVRTRIPSGVVSLVQLKKICELAAAYSHGNIHFTTRQDIQFHRVTLDNTADIIEGLLPVGIITRGTGGNTARNVVASPLSGGISDEAFDVSDYAAAATSHLLADPSVLNLPRKYKIAFSNTQQDTANATIADLGFIAKVQNGSRGFEVYGGGGLGSNAAAALKLAEFIPAAEILYHVEAMKVLFENEGDRSNKNKARIRYIVSRLGDGEFKKRYHDTLQTIKAQKDLDVHFDLSADKAIAHNPHPVYVHPENGNMDIDTLNDVIRFVEKLPYKATIRLTNTQGFYVMNLSREDAAAFTERFAAIVSPYGVDNSIACAGASTCQLGLCLSQNLLSAVKERFADAGPAVKAALPKIYISGCPNSCGQHQIGMIGLAGKARRVGGGLVPMYTLHLGGRVLAGSTRLAKPHGDLPARKIPEFLYQLAVLTAQSHHERFADFLDNNAAVVEELTAAYSTIEEENGELFYDFGAKERFTLKDRGPGECSAGVLDVIKLDIANAKASIVEYGKSGESTKLYQAAVSAARALLILKGVDTVKDREIFKAFATQFIDKGLVRGDIAQLLDHLIDYKLGDLDSLAPYLSDIEYVVDRVHAMYASLSPQLEITLAKEAETTPDHEDEKGTTRDVVDLRGVKCPMNFVMAKVALEEVSSGDTIGFYLDDDEPIRNVPRSLEEEGHETREIDTAYDGYNLLLVKKQ